MNPPVFPPLYTVAAAQSISLPGDVPANVQAHLAMVQAAAQEGVQLLVFPELSLTGYEPDLAARHVLGADDAVLAPLRDAARAHGMAVVVGAPVAPAVPGGLPAIGAWVFGPDGRAALYRKRHLHPGENTFASPGTEDFHVRPLVGQPTALAVCADTTHPEHARAARAGGAALYACGSVISEGAYSRETAQLQGYAAEWGMAVLLANHGGPTGGYACAGRSAFWAPGGACVAAAPGTGTCLVIVVRDGNGDGWQGRVLPTEPGRPGTAGVAGQ
ncbi:carbon-nitrogen hydrolase family protein [Acidovorax sp. SUPP2522]|uniref:carbon-nitrogen hydrolase family protein n=1 Tax=unclassified Acidovorax TaxID=2684926 RepID=UPI002349869A|nr:MULTISPECIES: carbon-nitrogen hydrolase family protein [unclassified Acidovorax]WCN00028.1 carbon-nitrogen hydrolase family protein [Acidovorax sp. GBBC 1281]GKT19111.1 carbon-nitrogen hydrolase family protein [Acidovorax sp. SUPP2522]